MVNKKIEVQRKKLEKKYKNDLLEFDKLKKIISNSNSEDQMEKIEIQNLKNMKKEENEAKKMYIEIKEILKNKNDQLEREKSKILSKQEEKTDFIDSFGKDRIIHDHKFRYFLWMFFKDNLPEDGIFKFPSIISDVQVNGIEILKGGVGHNYIKVKENGGFLSTRVLRIFTKNKDIEYKDSTLKNIDSEIKIANKERQQLEKEIEKLEIKGKDLKNTIETISNKIEIKKETYKKLLNM